VCRRATAAVEFALSLPVLILLILGIIEFGLMTFTDVLLEASLREASRHGITGNGSSTPVTRYQTLEQIVRDRTMSLAENLQFEMRIYDGFGSIDGIGGAVMRVVEQPNPNPPPDTILVVENPDTASSVVVYSVTADYRPFTPLLPAFLGQEGVVPLTASVAVRNEPWLTAGTGGTSP
jgi:Flp pilus assembly protein TadG